MVTKHIFSKYKDEVNPVVKYQTQVFTLIQMIIVTQGHVERKNAAKLWLNNCKTKLNGKSKTKTKKRINTPASQCDS